MSDIVRYKTLDVYRGRVDDMTKKTIDISRDFRFKLDTRARDLLTSAVASGGCFGAFSYEQVNANKALRIYVPHSGIVTAHLPTTNDITNAPSGTVPNATSPAPARTGLQFYDDSTKSAVQVGFRPAVLQAATDYADRWGDALPGGGRLQPTGDVLVPASDIYNMARYMNLAQINTYQVQMQKDVEQNGYTQLNVLGRQWRFIPDVTIASGTCYPIFNLKPGRVFWKPFMDQEFVETNQSENWERRWQRKCWGCYTVSQYRPRALRIEYLTTS